MKLYIQRVRQIFGIALLLSGHLIFKPCFTVNAQIYDDYYGNGHDQAVLISSSPVEDADEALGTLSGADLLPDLYGASRFLGQASMGADFEDIIYVSEIGIEAWLEEQFALQGTSFTSMVTDIQNTAEAEIIAVHGAGIADEINWHADICTRAFWQKVVTEEDMLRQRVALALSEILVVSQRTGTVDVPKGMASYYDILYQGAFGNFKDILTEVSLHPIMGLYLSHFSNRKADPSINRRPDENFAREIMQLFTIGLYELNIDGTEKTDQYGDPIATYDNDDIREMAKVWTGLSGSAWNLDKYPEMGGEPITFGRYHERYDKSVAMKMFEEEHESGSKYLLNGFVVPAGQSGMQDIEMALDHLFNHDNIGPFIARKLIKLLIKSNPTPAYVSRVATVFNNNGNGVRGDMRAVIRAIYTDSESRDCAWIDDPKAGRLREPLLRHSQRIRAFNLSNQSGRYWYKDDYQLGEGQKQGFLHSPTVFNFFQPDYANADLSSQNMTGPEFQILDANTAISYINRVEAGVRWEPLYATGTVDPFGFQFYDFDVGPDDECSHDFSDEIALLQTEGASALVDRLNLILAHGQLSEGTIALITNYANSLVDLGYVDDDRIVSWTVYAILISPSYVILK